MVQFYSEHNLAQGRYEQACREANASNQEARADWRKQIEDDLVTGGQQAITEYEAHLESQWRKANCLAEYDGVNMGYAILNRAKARLAAQTNDPAEEQ
jgi:hypothetical protein